MINILDEITRLRLKRNWTEYELAKRSDLPQSTISTWYRKNQTPSAESINRICSGLGITMSQFFAEGSDPISLTPEQIDLLDHWAVLDSEQQKTVMALIKSITK